MTIDEAIYCIQGYLPDANNEHCLNCPYFCSHQVGENVFLCESSEAHRMAIKALEEMKRSNEHER